MRTVPFRPHRRRGHSRSLLAGLIFAVLLLSLAGTSTAPSGASTGQHRVYRIAVILYDFADFKGQPVQAAEVKDRVFDRTGRDLQTGSVNSYYAEVTEGQISFGGVLDPTGDVFGWYTLDRSLQHPTGGQDYACPDLGEDARHPNPLLDEINRAAAADGFKFSAYDFVLYTSNVAACNASFKPPKVIFAAATGLDFWPVYNHELGHGLGLDHAGNADCREAGQAVVWGGHCEVDEYGDGQSTMGWGHALGHFNGYEKLRLGVWDLGADVVDGGRPGLYRLAPVTAASGGAARGLRVPIVTNPTRTVDSAIVPIYSDHQADHLFWYLDYRTNEGFNRATQPTAGDGVFLRVAPNSSVRGRSVILDGALNDAGDRRLQVGHWYEAPGSDLVIRVVPGSISPDGVEIEVRSGQLTVDPTELDLGTALIGGEPTHDIVEISNHTGVPVQVTIPRSIARPFLWNGYSGSLSDGQTISVRVDFAPRWSGSTPGQLQVLTDTVNGDFVIPLSGEGQPGTPPPGGGPPGGRPPIHPK